MAEAPMNKLAFFDFYHGTELDEAATEAAKRPIFRDVEMIRIRWAGNTKNEFHAPATDRSDRPLVDPQTNTKYWPLWKDHPDCEKAYEAFKKGQALVGNGTPLEEWAYLTAARRAELKAINIFTIDQIANMDAATSKRLGLDANKLRDQAKLYLERAEGAAIDERHTAEKEDMQRQIDELKAMVMGGSAPVQAAPAKVAKVAKPAADDAAIKDSPFYSMDEESIRLWIKEADPQGPQPHHKLGHEKLVSFADDLNARLAAARSKAA